jgi:3',5'-cyclic AMP phosphodiesterase CpdA
LKFIHLSDLHFRSKEENNREATATLEYIRNEYPTHKLIITGDIVDDGHEAQYKRTFDALQPFIGRIFICPGNHDFGAKGHLYGRERAERFDTYLSIPLQQGGTFAGENLPVIHFLNNGAHPVLLIALDTNVETLSPFDFACGQVGEKQLTALDRLLSDPSIANTIVIVFFHHHPFLHADRFKKLLDARDLMHILYGRVHLVLFGHNHVSKMWQDTLGVPFLLACDNSPGKQFAREITIIQKTITVNYITIEDEWEIVGQ